MREVVVFTKVPERGKVKTRLQKKLSAAVVAELYVAFLQDTLEKLRDFYPWVAYYPEGKVQVLWSLIGDRKYILQRGRDFGEKILNVANDFYKMGVKEVAIVGCDVPTMRKEQVEEAFALMDSNDLVFGPSHDGGFYLVGGSGIRRELFEGVDWEGKNVLGKIKENAGKLKLKAAYTETLHDVDQPEDIDAVWKSGELDKGSLTYAVLKKIK